MSFAGTLARKGAPVTFSHEISAEAAGNYAPLTGVITDGGVITLSGSAMEIEGDTDLYQNLGLVESNAMTLLFRPATAGTLPDLEWTAVWGGQSFTVKNVNRLAMAGSATAAKIVVSR